MLRLPRLLPIDPQCLVTLMLCEGCFDLTVNDLSGPIHDVIPLHCAIREHCSIRVAHFHVVLKMMPTDGTSAAQSHLGNYLFRNFAREERPDDRNIPGHHDADKWFNKPVQVGLSNLPSSAAI